MKIDKYAAQWDTEKSIKRATVISDKIRSLLTTTHYKQALEFGCGTGLVGFNLFDCFNELTFLDDSEEMIRIVEKKIETYGIQSANFIKIDQLKEKRNIGQFDVIFSSMVLHHIVNTNIILKEMYDALIDSGEIYLVDIDFEDERFHAIYPELIEHKGLCKIELLELMHSIGFNNVDFESFYFDEKKVGGETVQYSLFVLKAFKSKKPHQ